MSSDLNGFDMIQRARALLAKHAIHSDEAKRYAEMTNRDALRRFIVWCWECGDYSVCECVRLLFNYGYRGRELDLAWSPR